MSESHVHVPVLLDEVVSFVPDGKIVYLDLTLGRAGHAKAILERIPKGSVFVGVDRDRKALEESEERLKSFTGIQRVYLHSPYAEAFPVIRREGIEKADFILMDIGVSSPQFDTPERGFSYRMDGPLDMRMDNETGRTAEDIVMQYSERQLTEMFRKNAQCPYANLVSRRIVEKRRNRRIDSTLKLVETIKESLPQKKLSKKGHPAKQFFLALRYEVNGELGQLERGLEEALDFLSPGGRLAVIAFNFEEDRIVKESFRRHSRPKVVDKFLPQVEDEPKFLELTRKPIVPGREELERNPRAKSAILRVIEKRR